MPTRREMLSAAAAIATGNALLNDAIRADQNPAEQVVTQRHS